MTAIPVRRLWLGLLCSALLVLLTAPAATPALAVPPDPLGPPDFSLGKALEGPCGLAVDPQSNLYVADYYHHSVGIFSSSGIFQAQLIDADPVDGPCGLAIAPPNGLDPTGSLYVNNFHRNVVRYVGSSGPGTVVDPTHLGHPTGVAVDPISDNVYIDDRTYVAVYDPSGQPVLDEGAPLQIGLNSLGDGYGVAVSGFPATAGFVYVPDAADDTVKVYDPATDTENPVDVLDGHETPEGRFVSLRDSAVAVDRQSGRVYVADNLQPEYAEHPEAAVYAYGSSGVYAGRLKYNIVDALPPGLAVDNSAALTQGRVYVTSGNSEDATVYAYPFDALTTGVFPPLRPGVPAALPSERDGVPAFSPVPNTPAAQAPRSSSRQAAQRRRARQRVLQRRRARQRLARRHRARARHAAEDRRSR